MTDGGVGSGDADAGGRDGDGGTGGTAKWRCEWCEKPHGANDPPCDNCGHHKFEKAVVPVAPENPDHEREPVWVCPECGREHQKNSPPCSRCGHAALEKHTPDEREFDDLGAPSYLELLDPQYLAGLAVALVAGGVLVLALLGVVTLPGTSGGVPGDAESVHGLELSAVEEAAVAELDARRETAGLAPLDRKDRLDEAAGFYNQRRVAAAYDEGSLPTEDRLRDELDGACGGDLPDGTVAFDRSFDGSDDPAFESAETLAASLIDSYETVDETFYRTSDGRIGVDVHAGPDSRIFVTVFVC